MKKSILYIVTGLFIMISLGCEDYLDKRDPKATTFDEYFNDESDLKAMVYSSFYDVFTHKNNRKIMFYMQEGKSDNAYSRVSGDNHQEIANGRLDATTRAFEYYWTKHLKQVGRINMYLDNIDEPYIESDETREELEGNILALRTWHYFFLALRWGDIPYSEEPNTLEESKKEEIPHEKVMDTLFDAYPEIVDKLRGEEYSSDKYLFNKYSFKALIMRYALYDERYKLAVELAEDIMDSGMYELYPNYEDLFNYKGHISNNEFVIRADKDSRRGQATNTFKQLGPHYRTGNGQSYLVPTKALVDSYWTLQGDKIGDSPEHSKEEYELDPNLNRDPRYDASIMGNGDFFYEDTIDIYDDDSPMYYKEERASASGYWFKKFVDEDDAFKSSGNMEFPLLRYAEVLLTYAEAKIMMGEIDNSVKEVINQIRERAGLDMEGPNGDDGADVTNGKYESYSQDEWIDLIRNERRIELAVEGQRYDDIIRWKIAEDVLSKPAYGDTRKENSELESIKVENRSFDPSKNYLWPHMESDLRTNPNLEQTPGY